MSLEQAIKENTEAVRALTELFYKYCAADRVVTEKLQKDASGAAPAVEPTEPEPEVSYDELKKSFLKLVTKKGRDVGVAFLGELGVANLSELSGKPETFGHTKAKIEEKLNAQN